LNKGTNKRNTHAQIKIIEQRYKQEENTRTDKNNWSKVLFICACVFFLLVHLFNHFYLCVCFPLVYTFVELFLSVRLFPLICTFVQLFLSVRVQANTRTDKNNWTKVQTRRRHAHIKTIEQRYKQEENTRTDKNNWTKVQTRGIRVCFHLVYTFVELFLSVRLFPLICTFVQLFLSVRLFSSCLYHWTKVQTRGKQLHR
jgi:hypothetical protein